MDLKFSIKKQLGSGAFGKVYEVTSSATGTTFAAKVSTGTHVKMLVNESVIHSRMTHPNIVQFVSSFKITNFENQTITPLPPNVDGYRGVMILELCQGGTILTFMKATRIALLEQIKSWGGEIASALLYLKEQGIVHRDIKPDNILFCGDRVKLADFGLANYVEKVKKANFIAGSPMFLPPEAITKFEYGYYTDIYGFGVLLYLLYCGKYPHNANNLADLLNNKKTQPVKFIEKAPEETSIELEEMILRMMDLVPENRISIEEVVASPFFIPQVLDATMVISQGDDDNLQSDEMTLDEFRNYKAEFGEGDRQQFYFYLANKFPDKHPPTMRHFTMMYDQL